MARVVCQVLTHPHRVTLRWSEGNAHFEPYYLEGELLRQFWRAAELAKERRRQLAASEEHNKEDQAAAAFALAEAGHQLFQQIFPESGAFQALALEIRNWLRGTYEAGDLESFEITGDTTGIVAWNVVCESPPQQADFAGAEPHSDCWRQFWGIRYPLATTHRVNALGSTEILDQPEVLLVVDSELRHQLAAADEEKLQALAELENVNLADNYDDFAHAVQESAPDVLWLFCRNDSEGFLIGEVQLTPADLKKMLSKSDSPQEPWNSLLVIVNPANADGWETLRKEVFGLRLGGLIAPEHPLSPAAGGRFCLDLLEGFLQSGQPLGTAAQNRRSALAPHGLVFTAACPPELQAASETAEEEEESEDDNDALPLPEDPYRPLIPLDREDRALLAGRDDDIAAFSELMDAPNTRIGVLHGRCGVGKSSLLRSGVVPFMDRESPGYHALRDRTSDDEVEQEKEHPVLSIRATNDLAGQLALSVCAFADAPYIYSTPTGRTVTVDLPAMVGQLLDGESKKDISSTAITGDKVVDLNVKSDEEGESESSNAESASEIEPEDLRYALLKDKNLLGKLLLAFSERLPAELVLLIERGEELFSLSKTGEDVKLRRKSLEMLNVFAKCTGHSKIILSMRTEYFGRLMARLQPPPASDFRIGSYLLPALSVNQLVQVIEQPTLDQPINFAAQAPYSHYDFRYEDGLPRLIANEAVRAANEGDEEALPLVQTVCFLLHLQLEDREDRVIKEADLNAIHGVAGSIGRYVTQACGVVPSTSARRVLVLLESLCRVQPDGLLTQDLIPDEELLVRWTGRMPLAEVIDAMTADDLRLVEETADISTGEEISKFSLGHDAMLSALHRMGIEAKLKKHGRGRVWDTLFIMVPLLVLAVVGMWFFGIRLNQGQLGENGKSSKIAGKEFEKLELLLNAEVKKRWPHYIGSMHQAQILWQAGDIQGFARLLKDQVRKKGDQTDLRGYEWFYLWRLAQGDRPPLTGHKNDVISLAASADGKLIVSAGREDEVILWDLKSGDVRKLTSGSASTVALTPDGKLLAAAGDRGILLFDLVKGVGREQFQGHKKPVTAMAFTKDKKNLITASEDQTVKIWNIANGTSAATLSDHANKVRALALSQKGDVFASGDEDGKIIVWNVKNRKKLHSIQGKAAQVGALAFSPDGATLASAGARGGEGFALGVAQFWDPATGKPKGKDLQAPAAVTACLFSGDGKTLITGAKDNAITLWSVNSGKALESIKSHVGTVSCLALAGDGKILVSGSNDKTLRIWDLPRPPEVIQSHDDWILSLAISPDNKHAAAGGKDGTIKIWNLADGALVRTLKHGGPITGLQYASFGKKTLLASCGRKSAKKSGRLVVWDAATGAVFKELIVGPDFLNLALSDDGKILVASSADKSVNVWDVANKKVLQSLKGHEGTIESLSLYGNQELLGAGDYGVIYRWNIKKGKLIGSGHVMADHKGPIHVVKYLPDTEGKYAVSGGADQTIRLWDVQDGKAFEKFTGRQAVYAVSFSRLGLATAGEAGAVKLWHIPLHPLKDRKLEAFTFVGHDGPIRSIAWTSDRTTLVSAGYDGTVRIRRAVLPE